MPATVPTLAEYHAALRAERARRPLALKVIRQYEEGWLTTEDLMLALSDIAYTR